MYSPASEVLNHIASLARHLKGFGSEYAILIMLMELEINEKHDGFEYLRTSIYLFCEEPEQLITKGLYPAVAKQCGRKVSGPVIEHSIRTAIKSAWEKQGEMWGVYFPSGERPSNSEFIAKMSKYVELWKECCKAYKQQLREEVSQYEE